MQKIVCLKILPSEAAETESTCILLSKHFAIKRPQITGFQILKKSIDARQKKVFINLKLKVFIDEPFQTQEINKAIFKNVRNAKHAVIIIGCGPAGLFAALKLIENGIKPVIIERGKNVRDRRRDLAVLHKTGIINTESNYCFGEGGAGTYSDGKLYTRSTKRGKVQSILDLFVQFGANENILFDSHPHIGTNKLPGIITAVREQIIDCGGEVLFEKKLINIIIEKEIIKSVVTEDGDIINAAAVILATGHSARDIYELLYKKNILIEAKPFALGVRIEHPQALVDSIQYHCSVRDKNLPPASYNLTEQIDAKGVFSFCMCPGGIIAPAATSANELVVNGWSPSKRNNAYANSGIVAEVAVNDAIQYFKQVKTKREEINYPLTLMDFQKDIEQKCYKAGGGSFVAPAQRLTDFCENKVSASLPSCSYLPGVKSALLKEVLPEFIFSSIKAAFKIFSKKMKGFYTGEAMIVAPESRTSAPVRIPRDANFFYHPQIINLYPCGEGAGYAGGIVSAAMDGEKVASVIAQVLSS